MSTEPDFLKMISEARNALDRRRRGLLCRLSLRPPIDGDADRAAGPFREVYQLLATRGEVVWAALVQANAELFQSGRDHLPGVLVYSIDPYYDEHPEDLIGTARACWALKGTYPENEEMRLVARRLTEEKDQTLRLPIPELLTDNRMVFLAHAMFHRARFPGGVLSGRLLPVVIAPELTQVNMLLPLAYWPRELTRQWVELSQSLEHAAAHTSPPRAVRSVRARPLEPWEPDWDTDAMPVYVAPGMTQKFVDVRKNSADGEKWMLAIRPDPNGKLQPTLIHEFNPATEHRCTCNGVTVVIPKDRRRELVGAIVDYKYTELMEGAVLYLPGTQTWIRPGAQRF